MSAVTPQKVALATYDARPQPTDDDALLADALSERGAEVHAMSWSDPTGRWSEYDAVVVRSTWDYFRRPQEFHAWLDRLEADGARVHNDVRILRWNADKSYLRELDAAGIPVIPTRWIARGASASLAELRHQTGWDELVVKPTVSGGAHRTWRTAASAQAADEERLAEMIDESDLMIQPLVEEIEREGEWSLLFFAGVYSHAVLKRPRSGDFRVQREHGGSLVPVRPADAVIESAARAIAAIPVSEGAPLYARVDGCVVDGRLMLMELEVLEPELFLRCEARAADRLAGEVLATMKG